MSIHEEFEACYDKSFEEILPAQLLEQYYILECLSCTDGCDTLLVEEKTTGKRIVAKCYTRDSILSEQAEIAQLEGVDSTAIPRFVGEYKNEKCRCVLREYIEGTPLDKFVIANRMTEHIITDMAIELANIMKLLHSAEPVIIHRDIKPQNIIVKEDGSLALIDFGISRIYKKDVTADTICYGTQDFAPPEQYGFMQTDIRSDIYSFGIVLAWLITGKAKPIKEPLTKLERVAAKCCEFSPNKRYKDDDALINALRKTSSAYKFRMRKRRNVIVAAGIAVLMALFAGLAVHRYSIKDEVVAFKEPLVEEAVRLMLDKPHGEITYQDLEEVTEIYILGDKVFLTETEFWNYCDVWDEAGYGRGTLTDISDLEYMPNLQKIFIGKERISDISPMKHLDKLMEVELRNNDVEDLSPLANKESLCRIGFNSNNLNSIETISTCPLLQFIDFRDAGDFDGSPIASVKEPIFMDIACDSDAYLYLDGMSIEMLKVGSPGQTDLACIRNVSGIKDLYIYWSEITDISALEGRDDIAYLNMTGCMIEDLSPLFTMSNLKTVELSPAIKEQMEDLISVYDEPEFEIIYTE